MMTAEHRRPLAAFLLVFAGACLIMGNGLRTQVVDILIGSGAPSGLITAIAPDMVLGHSLKGASVQLRPKARAEVPVTALSVVPPDVERDAVVKPTVSAVQESASSQTTARGQANHLAGHAAKLHGHATRTGSTKTGAGKAPAVTTPTTAKPAALAPAPGGEPIRAAPLQGFAPAPAEAAVTTSDRHAHEGHVRNHEVGPPPRGDSRHDDSRGDSRHSDSRHSDSRDPESRHGDSRGDSRHSDPRHSDPRHGHSHQGDSRGHRP